MMHKAESDHERCPERVMWQTESYPRDAFHNWKHTAFTPYIIGDIVWTGLDYLGESGIGQFYYEGEPNGEHYQRNHFPFHGAYCGDVDMTGWRKPISHYRDMLYNVKDGNTDFIYMAVKEPNNYKKGKISETAWSVWPTWESWNWQGWEGKQIEVEVYTKAPAVNLYLNDQLIATKKVNIDTEYKAVFPIPYQAGTLKAVTLDHQGKEVASTLLATAEEPYALRLTPEQTSIKADGVDLSYIILEVTDKNGRVVPEAEINLDVDVRGQGSLVAVASASFKDLEPTTSHHVTTYKGRAVIVVRSTQKAGSIQVATKSAIKNAKCNIKTGK